MAPLVDSTATQPPDAADDRTSRRHALRLRLLSALVLLPLALIAVEIGFPVFDLLIAAAAVLMAREWVRLTMRRGGAAMAALSAVALALVMATAAGFDVVAVLAAAVAGTAGLYLAAKIGGLGGASWLGFGVLAIGVPCLALDWLRQGGDGRATVYWVLAVVWATDTGAYVFGRWIGGPKLAPRISPKKTWAGLIGGIVCAAAVGLLAGALTGSGNGFLLALLSGALAMVAQGGDLGESSLKRHFGVKDSGGLIPGHGGILDRVDGLLAVAPLVAFLTWATGSSLLAWS